MSLLRRIRSGTSGLSLGGSMPALELIRRLTHWIAQPHGSKPDSHERCADAATYSTTEKPSNAQLTDRVTVTILPTNAGNEEVVIHMPRRCSPKNSNVIMSDSYIEISTSETLVSPPSTLLPSPRGSTTIPTSATPFIPSRPSTPGSSKRSSRVISPQRKSMVRAIDNYLAMKKRVNLQIREQFHQVHVLSEKVSYLDAAIEQCDGGGYRRSTVDPDTVALTRSRYYTDKQDVLQEISQCFKMVQNLQGELSNAQNQLRQLDDGGPEADVIREFLQTLTL